MKNFTPSLVNKGKVKLTLKGFFLGSAGSKPKYYEAFHKTEDIYILWLEAERFSTWHCFPCVIEEDGDPLIYASAGKGSRGSNAAVINRWNVMVPAGEFEENFEATELTPDNFSRVYGKYKNMKIFGKEAVEELESGKEEAAGETSAEETPAKEDASAADESPAEYEAVSAEAEENTSEKEKSPE